MKVTEGERCLNAALRRARDHAPFLKLQLDAFPDIADALAAEDIFAARTLADCAGAKAPDIGAALRRERRALALVLGIGDLAGVLALEEVVRPLSGFADDAIARALEAAMADRDGTDGFCVLALGKLGSRELNYSSDVDLILLFDPERLPLKPREEPGQAAVRIAHRMVEILQKRDGEGYVFRVDLRLRPSPEATPIALSVNAAISYYESIALPWERAAFVRARHAAGDAELGAYFLTAIHSFVWRRSVDFGAIGELGDITRRIRGHYAQGQALGPGYDLKRGRGGIREIEFFVQIQQLIHGGREPGLRAPATLDALAALGRAGRIDGTDAAMLADAYRLLRTIEHRLQMVEDRQTHSLPDDPAALANVAQLHGLPSGEALVECLRAPVEAVGALYDALAGEEQRRLPAEPQALEAELARLGITDAAAVRPRIEGWRSGKARSLRTAAAREAFEAMLPGLIEALAAAPDALRAINRFDDIVMRLPSAVNFYRLIEARPDVAEVLATILSHAPALADQLGRRPELLDGLINRSAFEPPPPVALLAERFAASERAGEDYQALLDRVRRTVGELRFALGAQLVTARADPVEVAAGYARVAEAAINVLAHAATIEFEKLHGRVEGSELLILGLGRLGGEGLTHASDLDLVYLFTGSHEAQSDGAKPLGATDYFNRLAMRVTAALSVPTAAGPLYDVDTRLRPSGADGLLAVTLDSFASYQAAQAWTWEHMALTRARPVYGSNEGRAALQQVLDQVLTKPRDCSRVIADAAAMRTEMATHKPPAGRFDIKLGEGGLVDLEFAVHTLQLCHHAGLVPRLEHAIAGLIAAGLLPPDIEEAHYLLARMLITLRLVSPDSSVPPEASRPLVAHACRMSDWDSLLAAHDAARQRVAETWHSVAGIRGDRDGE